MGRKRYMLNVGKITTNIGRGAKAVANKVATGARNTLTAAGKASAPNLTGDVYQDALNSSMGKFGKLLSKLKDGEYMNILVTAFGTAVVAPIFIAFNPLSKKDKETKMYSALRQPISAVIAVAAQMSVVKALNNALDKYASTGGVKGMDLRDKQKESYLKKLIKMENPDITKEELKEAIKKRQTATFEEAIKKATESFKDTPVDEILTKENSISVKDYTEKIKELKAQNGGKLSKDLKGKVEDLIFADTKKAIQEKAQALVDKGKCANLDDAVRQETIKKFVNAKIAKAGDVLSSNKKYLGIVLSLLTLPVTCGILNWAYPRIVEKFFPDLANSKKQSEAKKAEAQAQPQPSVQKTEEEDD